MPPHPSTNFEMPKYYPKAPKFKGINSRNYLPKIKNGAYVVNLDKYKSIRTHWIALNLDSDNVAYFDSLGVEYISKEVKKLIGKFISNIFQKTSVLCIICDKCASNNENILQKNQSTLKIICLLNVFISHQINI